MSAGHEIHRVAERALLVRFLDADLERAVARTHAVLSLLNDIDQDQGERLPLKGEWIPGAGSFLVRFDGGSAAEACRENAVDSGASDDGGTRGAPRRAGGEGSADEILEAGAVEAVRVRLDEILRLFPFNGGLSQLSKGREVEISVAFGSERAGESGDDLAGVAAECALPASEVVARFCAATYTVAFVGFSPGFPYLIGLPPELQVARLPAPRPRVPAGAVAIAGPFAGIYPSATPGGWRLLGAAEVRLFDPAAMPPARLVAGDRVRFVAR